MPKVIFSRRKSVGGPWKEQNWSAFFKCYQGQCKSCILSRVFSPCVEQCNMVVSSSSATVSRLELDPWWLVSWEDTTASTKDVDECRLISAWTIGDGCAWSHRFERKRGV